MVAYIAKCFIVWTLAPDFAVVKLIIEARGGGLRVALLCQKPLVLIFCGQVLLGLWQWGSGCCCHRIVGAGAGDRGRLSESLRLTLTRAVSGDTIRTLVWSVENTLYIFQQVQFCTKDVRSESQHIETKVVMFCHVCSRVMAQEFHSE